MIRLFFFVSIFTLVGCESDFQKCMNTELPRSVKAMKIDEARNQLLVLDELRALAEKEDTLHRALIKWWESNPHPISPEGMSWSDFAKTEAKLAHDAKENLAFVKISESIGFEEKTIDEVKTRIKLFETEVDIALRPRAITYNCWGDADCDSPLLEEVFFLSRERKEDQRWSEVAINGLNEAKVMLSEEIAKMSEQSMTLATVACNTNGFYE